MGEDVEQPWAEGIDVMDAEAAYFDPRTTSLSVYDKDGSIEALATATMEHYNLDSINETFDRAVRMYLAYLLDSDDSLPDLREDYEVAGAIPPAGWIESFERTHIEPADGEFHGGSMTAKTVKDVKDMVVEVIEETGDYDTQTEFVIASLKWLTCND